MQGIGQVVHELVQHISTGGRQVYPFRCDPVIHKLFQHISTEGGSEQEGNLSFQVFLYKGLQYMLSCMVIYVACLLLPEYCSYSQKKTHLRCVIEADITTMLGDSRTY